MKETPAQPKAGRLYTAADAARVSGLSYFHIRHLARSGIAPVAAVVGRGAPLFDVAGIEWLRARRRARGSAAA